MRTDRRAFLAFGLVVAFLAPSATDSCGLDPARALFVLASEPDDPFEGFRAGRIGVIQPGWRQAYLFVAYRYLSELPLETQARDRARQIPTAMIGESEAVPWSTRWRDARAKIGSTATTNYYLYGYCRRQIGDTWVSYYNFPEDAFRNAVETLADRQQREGGMTPAVLDWVRGQDAVFATCDQPRSEPPGAAPEGSPDWLVADRAYQSAAWLFYSGSYNEAAAAFDAIAKDEQSPWRGIAPYLAARAWTRNGMVNPEVRGINEYALREAERRTQEILADPSFAPVHDATRRLASYIGFRLHPDDRLAQLGRTLLEPTPASDLDQQVTDFTMLLDHFQAKQVHALAAGHTEYELADWILSLQAYDHDHTLERWRATRSRAWLVAAMTTALGPSPAVDELLRATEQVGADEPAFPSVVYQRARLLWRSGRNDAARSLLDSLPTEEGGPFSPSTANLLRALRLRLAEGLDDLVRFAPRRVAGIAGYSWVLDDPRDKPGALRFDLDGERLLNRFAPVETVAGLAADPRLDPRLRRDLTVAAWTRAALLERFDVASTLAPALAATAPSLGPFLAAIESSSSAEERRFTVAWLLLHAEGTSPWVRSGFGRLTSVMEHDDARDNWWYLPSSFDQNWPYRSSESGDTRYTMELNQLYPTAWDRPVAEKIFSTADREQADRELADLVKAGQPATYFPRQALAWAERSPGDPRVPEALHRAVRATRYAAADATSSSWSRRAFQLLHRRYPNSPWTKKTKYWY